MAKRIASPVAPLEPATIADTLFLISRLIRPISVDSNNKVLGILFAISLFLPFFFVFGYLQYTHKLRKLRSNILKRFHSELLALRFGLGLYV